MHRRSRTRHWQATVAALAITGAIVSASTPATATTMPQPARHLAVDGDCGGDGCGLNHNQVLV